MFIRCKLSFKHGQLLNQTAKAWYWAIKITEIEHSSKQIFCKKNLQPSGFSSKKKERFPAAILLLSYLAWQIFTSISTHNPNFKFLSSLSCMPWDGRTRNDEYFSRNPEFKPSFLLKRIRQLHDAVKYKIAKEKVSSQRLCSQHTNWRLRKS